MHNKTIKTNLNFKLNILYFRQYFFIFCKTQHIEYIFYKYNYLVNWKNIMTWKTIFFNGGKGKNISIRENYTQNKNPVLCLLGM